MNISNVFIILFFIFFTSCKNSLPNDFYSEIKDHQDQLNQEFRNPKETPLRGKYLEEFKRLPFFSINLEYKVVAKLEKIENSEPFDFPTSSGTTKRYRKYGYIHFTLQNKPITLSVYQSLSLLQKDEFKDYLFLPFRDLTNGKSTYGGGRYLDLRIPKGESIVVDLIKRIIHIAHTMRLIIIALLCQKKTLSL